MPGDREDTDLRTLTWSLPSSPNSASVSTGCLPSNDMTSESTLKEAMDPAFSGNCSVMRILAARYSYMMSNNVYHMMHCNTTACTVRFPGPEPYMAARRGVPITSVLGMVLNTKMVIIQSKLPHLENRTQIPRQKSTNTLDTTSAAMNRKFIVYGSLPDMN